jgi:hypothetical protein
MAKHVLAFTWQEWDAFVSGVRTGVFDDFHLRFEVAGRARTIAGWRRDSFPLTEGGEGDG